MLSITEVPRSRLYRPNMSASLPQLRPKKSPYNTKQQLATQKLFTELNAEFLDNSIISKRHSINTQIQTDSFLNQTQPKIDLISHQTENMRKSIETLDKKVDTMCSDAAAKLKRFIKDIDLKTTLLANKTSQEIKNTQEINGKYQKHVEWVNQISQSKIQELFTDQSALKEKSDNLALSTETVIENARGKLKILTPKVSQLDMNAQEVESTIQRRLTEHRQMMQLLSQLKDTRKTLKSLEDEGVDNMVSEHYGKIVNHLTDATNTIDKKTVKKEIQEGDCEENIKMSAAENENLVSRLDQLSKQIQDNDTNIDTFTELSQQQIETTVDRLHEVVSQLKEELSKNRHDTRHDKWLSQRNSIREMKYQSKIAQERSDKLQNDWVLFNKNNDETQKEVNKQIDDLYGKFGGDLEMISYRVDVCYEKIQWCKKRLLQWQRYNANELEVSIQKIIDAEKNLLNIEDSLKAQDKQKPVAPPYKLKKGTVKPINTKPPQDIEEKEAIEGEKPKRKLTYTDQELNQPDLPIPRDTYEEEDFEDSDDDEQNLFMMDSDDENKDRKQSSKEEEDDNEEEESHKETGKQKNDKKEKPRKQRKAPSDNNDDEEEENDEEKEDDKKDKQSKQRKKPDDNNDKQEKQKDDDDQPKDENDDDIQDQKPEEKPKERRRKRKEKSEPKQKDQNPPVNDPNEPDDDNDDDKPKEEPERRKSHRSKPKEDGENNDEKPHEHKRRRKRKA